MVSSSELLATDVPQIKSKPGYSAVLLFLASFAALYFELVVIRYLSTEVRVFAYLKNLALLASFFGIGFGMMLENPPKYLKARFPWIAAFLILLITYATYLRLTFLPIPSYDYRVYMDALNAPTGSWVLTFFWEIFMVVFYLVTVTAIMFLVVAFFAALGSLIGDQLRGAKPLQGYGVNLLGSLTGIVAFTAISFFTLPPAFWVFIGLLSLVPFYRGQRVAIAVFALTVAAMLIPQANTFWSPYYRITLTAAAPPQGWPRPAVYMLDVNHLFHQRVLDLSPEFLARYPHEEQNAYGFPTYELPYKLAPQPGKVLVIGAGTGNDVAAALRHGATHVDAIEIDPVILALGRKYHPEHPYDSPRVTVHIDDARAYLRNANQQYDLIVFGYLDSHTMLSSLSSIRLDNYVYTVESLRDARHLLAPGGTLVLGFGGGHTFLSDRLYATLHRAFEAPPLAYFTGYDGSGVLFVEGQAALTKINTGFPEISAELSQHEAHTLLATDHWPFLYLQSRTVPTAIWTVLALFLYFASVLLQRQVPLRQCATPQGLHFFFLGAGFMLLETRGVTELSLLFGSTWIVNSVVIAAFLTMAILANFVVLARPVSRRIAYPLLFAALVAGMVIPYESLVGLSSSMRILFGAGLGALPVFFSGFIFSRSFRDAERPAQALGVNLLGSVVGGVLENLVMVGGTPVLGILSLLLYGLSAYFLVRASSGSVPAQFAPSQS